MDRDELLTGACRPISTQIYSLFDDQPPRPAIPHFRLPECYHVKNVGPIETKISNFNEDTLFFIFYANAGDVTQHLAAQELYVLPGFLEPPIVDTDMGLRSHARSWRWHKKLQVWLTKDEHMMPQQISPTVERGFYIIWDPIRFQRDRVSWGPSSVLCTALVANRTDRGSSRSTMAILTPLWHKARNERLQGQLGPQRVRVPYMKAGDAGQRSRY